MYVRLTLKSIMGCGPIFLVHNHGRFKVRIHRGGGLGNTCKASNWFNNENQKQGCITAMKNSRSSCSGGISARCFFVLLRRSPFTRAVDVESASDCADEGTPRSESVGVSSRRG